MVNPLLQFARNASETASRASHRSHHIRVPPDLREAPGSVNDFSAAAQLAESGPWSDRGEGWRSGVEQFGLRSSIVRRGESEPATKSPTTCGSGLTTD